jgi:cytochrome c oxidase subunit II
MKRTSASIVIALVAVFAIAAGWRRHASASTPTAAEQVIHMTAKKFEYTPNEITLKKGVPVVLEITSLDRDHGFKVPEFGLRADVKPGETTRVRLVPDRVGRFEFRCDVFCGSGHEDMAGEIVVVD